MTEANKGIQANDIERILGVTLPANGQVNVEIVDDRPNNNVKNSPFRVTRETRNLMVSIKDRVIMYW